MDFLKKYEINESELKIIANQDFKEVVKKNNSFENYYNLYKLRQNLFNWYPFKNEGNLLEIGAGYGQLTSLFVQKINNVVVIEDSESNAEFISNKVKEANVFVSDFDKIEVNEKFDYIILCNLFEYAKLFYDSDNSHVDYLKYLKTFLKDDGVILIALSNRLGLKYFAGFKEEHTNQFFKGIDGFSGTDNVQTFTKPELIKIIENAGFDNYKFFYPYPDHEFPQIINTDKFVNLIPYTKKPIYFKQRSNLFDEGVLNQTLANDGMADYFSNSFLIEIRNSNKNFKTDNINFIKVNAQRKPEFQNITIIHNNKISKYPISNKANDHIKKMYGENEGSFGKIKYLKSEFENNILSYEYIQNKSLKNLIEESIRDNDKKSFNKLIQDYYDALIYNSYETDSYASDNFISIFKKKSTEKFHCHVKSNLDLDFSNIFIINDEFIAVDYEWIFNFPVPIEYIFYRTIKYNIESNPLFNKFTSFTEIFRYLRLNLSHIELFEIWDKNLFKYIYEPIPVNDHKIIPKENLDYAENIDEYVELVIKSKDINSHNFESLKKDIVLNQRRIINQKNNEIRKKDNELKQKDNEVKNKKKEINNLLNSTSWKITKPLRKFKSIFK